MYKTITLRVSKEDLQQIQRLRERHFQQFQSAISQSQLIRNLIHQQYKELGAKEAPPRKEELFTEKEEAHKRDLTIVDRLRERRWVKGRK